MEAKLAKKLDIIREDTNWRDPRVKAVEISRGKPSEGTVLAGVKDNFWSWSNTPSKELEFDNLVIGSASDVVAQAMMLGDINISKNESSLLLFLPLQFFDSNSSVSQTKKDAARYLEEHMDIIFDERTNTTSVKAGEDVRSIWWRPNFRYVGNNELPERLAYVYCRNRFLDVMRQVWNDTFILRPRENNVKEKSIKTIGRSTALANLLLLGRGNFDAFAKKGKCASWEVSALRKLDVPIASMPESIRDVAAEVSRIEDVASFWCRAADDYGWALRMSSEDLEDNKIENTKKKIAKMAELIDLESYLDTYEAGVPASDILA